MINHRLRALIRKEFIQIVRDPRTLYIILAIPVIQIFLLGYTATTDVRNVPAGGVRPARAGRRPAACWTPTGRRTTSAWTTTSTPRTSCAR